MGKWDRTLIVAPHADDETLGCGGLLARLARAGKWTGVAVATLDDQIVSQASGRTIESSERRRELFEAKDVLGVAECSILYHDKGQQLDMVPISEIVGWIDRLLEHWQPTAVLLPIPSFNKDHTVTFESGLAALRPRPVSRGVQLVGMYEYPYSLCWQHEHVPGAGSLYVPIAARDLESKLEALGKYSSFSWDDVDSFHPTSKESVVALARERGREIGVEHAELIRVLFEKETP